DGVAAGAWLRRLGLPRLRRGDAALRSRARIADAPGSGGSVVRIHQLVSVGDVPGPGARELRTALRPPVLPRLDRFPRYPGRVHARSRDRLLRELAARNAGAALVRDREPRRLARLRREHLGPYRQRRAG